jgi:two-component system, chemotaxis family, protein-glutamate methylesterase/glutaminase
VSTNRIFVVGASAGGVETLKQLVSLLPPDFPAPILIVLHVSPHGTSVLPQILSRARTVPAIHPEEGQPLKPGIIYIAPPDQHLLVKRDKIHLSRGPRENGHRPAVDTLFRSAARVYGPRVVGVVLSGVLDDGTAGLSTIVRLGGVAVVQDPSDALYSGMPESAIEHVNVHHVLPTTEIASLMVRLAQETVAETQPAAPDDLEYETDIVELDMDAIENDNKRPGRPSSYVCPECGGSLWEISENDVLRFRCHVGHAYSAETFLAEQTDSVEEALWVALRVLEDNISLTQRMAERASTHNRPRAASRFADQIANAQSKAKLLRDILKSHALALPEDDSNKSRAGGVMFVAGEIEPDEA